MHSGVDQKDPEFLRTSPVENALCPGPGVVLYAARLSTQVSLQKTDGGLVDRHHRNIGRCSPHSPIVRQVPDTTRFAFLGVAWRCGR